MKRRDIIITLAFIAALAVIIFCLWSYTHSPRFRAQCLLSELRRLNESPGRLVQLLNDIDMLENDRNAEDIMEDLADLGPSAVAVLIPALKENDSLVQIMVARTLGRMGLSARSAIPALIEVLNTKQDIEFLNEAALALGCMGAEAAPFLIEVEKNKDIKKRMFAVMALVEIDKDFADDQIVSFLIEILDNENSRFRERATWTLGEIGPAAQKAVPDLIRTWNDQDDKANHDSLHALIKIGKPALPQLIQTLQDKKNKIIRFCAASAITDIDPNLAARHITDVLGGLLQDPDKKWRQSAARLLENMGSDVQTAFPLLLGALKDQDVLVRIYAVMALDNINIATPEILSALVEAVGDKDPEVRESAIRALGKKKIASPKVIDALIPALKDPEYFIRTTAAVALGYIDPPAQKIRTALRYALNDPHFEVRHAAALSLFKITSDAQTHQEVIALLLDALNNKNGEVRLSACLMLMNIGPDAQKAAPALKKTLKDKFMVVRINAAWALAKIDPDRQGPSALNIITKALKNEDDFVRFEALLALEYMDPVFDEVVPALASALKDKESDLRRRAARALGNMGPAAKEAVPALKEALTDRDENVRRAAAEVLEKINGKKDKNRQY